MRLNEWMSRYEIELVKARKEHPDRYLWPDGWLPQIVAKMRECFEKGHFNKDSLAIRATCKHFEIPLSFSAIAKFIKGDK